MLKVLKEKHDIVLDGGYGKLKGKTFRISNMGDETPETMRALLAALDNALGV
jgi:aspartate aminotransferase-like enzyme